MAGLPKPLVRAVATVAQADVPVPAAKTWVITNIILSNTGINTVKGTVLLDGFALIPGAQIGAGGILTLDCAQVLATGKNLSYKCDTATALNVHISGVEMDA